MGKEIEKKYLLWENNESFATEAFFKEFKSMPFLAFHIRNAGTHIKQGYFDVQEGIEIARGLGEKVDFEPSEARVRFKRNPKGELSHFLTLKGKGGLERNELEESIHQLLHETIWPYTKGQRVQKYRFAHSYGNQVAEYDFYTDRDLIVAEIEVPSIEIANALVPLGLDITEDPAYKNKNLAK